MKKFQLLKSLLEHQYSYVGSCTNSFEDDSCSFSNYIDVTDFAQGEEKSIEIQKSYFLSKVKYNPIIDHCDIFLYDSEHDVYIAYDSNNDVHYFFT